MATSYQIHEVANIFPRMTPEEYVTLKNDIKANGLREPIWLHEGKIIDGRNRYWACQDVGVELRVREWDGNGSLVSFVVSLNLHRRHLSESQRAMIGARIRPLFEEESKQRQIRKPADFVSAYMQKQNPSEAAAEAAKAVNVSTRSVYNAAKVLRDGAPELVEAAESGEVSVTAAAEVAKLPKEEQAKIVAKGPQEVKRAAKANIEKDAKRLKVKPEKTRIYEGTTFSALTVAVQVDLMLDKISWKDPNAMAALDKIAESIQRRRELIEGKIENA